MGRGYEIYRKLQESTEQLRMTKVRLSALETLLNDNKEVIAKKNSKVQITTIDKQKAQQYLQTITY